MVTIDMRPQDYPNLKHIDEELRQIQREIVALDSFDHRLDALLGLQRDLLRKRKKQLEFNEAMESND